jgi:hypothetical protein
MVDHWVTEYRSAGTGRWVRVDAQLDDLQRTLLQPSFDPDDMAPGPFLPAGEAWQACRRGEADPARFGIFDMWGLWFVLGNVVRDLAALNKVELLPWDTWGPMRLRQDPDPTEGELIDTVASVMAAGDASAVRALYDGTDSLKVPAAVFDGRFGVPYQLDAGGGP